MILIPNINITSMYIGDQISFETISNSGFLEGLSVKTVVIISQSHRGLMRSFLSERPSFFAFLLGQFQDWLLEIYFPVLGDFKDKLFAFFIDVIGQREVTPVKPISYYPIKGDMLIDLICNQILKLPMLVCFPILIREGSF